MKIAWRNLIRNRRYAIQNLLGLVTAMTAFLLIMRYTAHEEGYDQHFPEPERLFRITSQFSQENELSKYATSPPPLGPLLRTREGLYQGVCRVFTWSDFTLRTAAHIDQPYREQNVWIVDSSFFTVFQLPLLQGNPRTALANPGTFVLTKSTAIKYFGEDAFARNQIVGKSLLVGKDGGMGLQIGGVIADPPKQSHFQFDILMSDHPNSITEVHEWTWNVVHTYVRLASGVTVKTVNEDLKTLVASHILAEASGGSGPEPSETVDVKLVYKAQSILDIHLHSHLQREMRPNGHATYVWLLWWVGLGILILAMINYLNLATAQATQRFSTNGIRKLMGASRNQLVQETLAESVLIAGVSATIAFLLAEQLSPIFFQYFLGYPLVFISSALTGVFSWLGLSLGVGLVAGLFPALYLSRVNLRDALRKVQTGGGRQPFRRVLVTGQ
ncbi:MAG: ABC transporter permease, partial [Bacteroidota bacterium]